MKARKQKRAVKISDKTRMDFLEAGGFMLDASSSDSGALVYLDVHGHINRAKTIRKALDAAIREWSKPASRRKGK